MNPYREERIQMIGAMMMALAGMAEDVAIALLQSTMTYRNIIDGEECTLYESYSANLEDVAEELRDSGRAALSQGIKNARQLKDRLRGAHSATVTRLPNEMGNIACLARVTV